jgi:hypothetical protein
MKSRDMIEKFYRMPEYFRDDLRCYDDHTLRVIRTWKAHSAMPFDMLRRYTRNGKCLEFGEIKTTEICVSSEIPSYEFFTRFTYTFELLGHRWEHRDGTTEDFEFINVMHNGRIIDIIWNPEVT